MLIHFPDFIKRSVLASVLSTDRGQPRKSASCAPSPASMFNAIARRGRWGKGTSKGNRALCVHSGPDNLEELLDKHVVTGNSKKPATEEEGRGRLITTRREALALYRDILRSTRLFLWSNEQGILWKDVLRSSTRKEFEEARFEQDPEIIARLLVGGRDALQQAVENAIKQAQKKAPNNDPPP